MFNQTLQAGCTDPVSQTQLVSWIQQGWVANLHTKATASTQPAPARAMPLHVMIEQVSHGGTSLCKKNNFTHHFPTPLYTLTTARWLVLTPHTHKNATKLQHPNAPHTGSRPQTYRLAHHPLHAHERQERNRYSEMPSRHIDGEERSDELSSPGALRDCKEECKLS